MTTGYHLKLSQFEGPLDLLVHLIRVHEIDIFNIDIFVLTTQYLEYLRLIRFDDLTDAGDFLEMAATLIEIKTRMLLPNLESGSGAELDLDEDPRKTLGERLILNEQFAHAAYFLASSAQLDAMVFYNHEYERLSPLYEDIQAPLICDQASLVIMYEQLMRSMSEKKPPAKLEAITHQVTVEQKIKEIESLIRTVRYILFQGFYERFRSRYELVVSILAILELTKWGKLRLFQKINGHLYVCDPCIPESELPDFIFEEGFLANKRMSELETSPI